MNGWLRPSLMMTDPSLKAAHSLFALVILIVITIGPLAVAGLWFRLGGHEQH